MAFSSAIARSGRPSSAALTSLLIRSRIIRPAFDQFRRHLRIIEFRQRRHRRHLHSLRRVLVQDVEQHPAGYGIIRERQQLDGFQPRGFIRFWVRRNIGCLNENSLQLPFGINSRQRSAGFFQTLAQRTDKRKGQRRFSGIGDIGQNLRHLRGVTLRANQGDELAQKFLSRRAFAEVRIVGENSKHFVGAVRQRTERRRLHPGAAKHHASQSC